MEPLTLEKVATIARKLEKIGFAKIGRPQGTRRAVRDALAEWTLTLTTAGETFLQGFGVA